MRPRCGFYGAQCPNRAIAEVRYPLTKPWRERQRMHVCDPHLDAMARIWVGRDHA